MNPNQYRIDRLQYKVDKLERMAEDIASIKAVMERRDRTVDTAIKVLIPVITFAIGMYIRR